MDSQTKITTSKELPNLIISHNIKRKIYITEPQNREDATLHSYQTI